MLTRGHPASSTGRAGLVCLPSKTLEDSFLFTYTDWAQLVWPLSSITKREGDLGVFIIP